MSRSAPSIDEIDLSWRMRDREAAQLAELIRSSRLTLLHAEPGVGRTELLTGGLLPLLRRRASDAVGDEDRESRVVIPFSERRTRRGGRSSIRVAERVVLFDDWSAQPLAALRAAVVASLPDDASTYARSARLAPMLGELSRRFDAQFLIILDSFERFWHPALSLEEAGAFVDQLSEAIEADDLRAHFLLSIDDLADPRLDMLRQRINGFDQSALHLLRWDSRGTMAPPAVDPVAFPVLHEALQTPLASPAAPLVGPAVAALPVASPPASLPAAAAPIVAPGPAPASRDKPRRAKLPRPPLTMPEPIRREAVYAFIESTLTQTASDFAPWHDGDEETSAASSGAGPGASLPRQQPRGVQSNQRRNGFAAGADAFQGGRESGREGSQVSAGSAASAASAGVAATRTSRPGSTGAPSTGDVRALPGGRTTRSSSSVDGWLGSVSDWMRRRLRQR